MYRNEKLYQFLLEQSENITEKWYASINQENAQGVYAATTPSLVADLKQENLALIRKVIEVFKKDHETVLDELGEWIERVSTDEQHFRTPLYSILMEFHRTQDRVIETIDEFIHMHEGEYSVKDIVGWYDIMNRSFRRVIRNFVEQYTLYSDKRLKAQQELILELSSPVITIREGIALLPLVGDIDTQRSKFILENTLSECGRLGIRHLFLDLSGVVLIDTMVAQHLFQLIDALRLLGVKTTLSGIRPEIAQTAVQLGVSFDEINITSSLSIALNSIFH